MSVSLNIVGTLETVRLRMNEKISVGSSSRSQFTVDDSSFAPEHFFVSVRADGCWLNCSEGQSVAVNGQIVSLVQLSDQDLISLGQTAFRVSIEGQLSTEEEVILPKYTYSFFESAKGLLFAESSSSLAQLTPLFEDLGQKRNSYVLANFKAAQLPCPSHLMAEEDLFFNAPAEIRNEYSLHCRQATSIETLLQIYEPLRAKDAAVVLFSELSREELLQKLKFYFAWFSKPSSLKFHLQEGTSDLTGKLLEPVHCVFAEPKGGNGWWCVSSKEKAPDWKTLGLTESPANTA